MAKSAASLLLVATAIAGAAAQQTVWGQCGGIGYSGPTNCVSGSACSTLNPYYAQCLPGATSSSTTTTSKPTSTTSHSSTTPASTGPISTPQPTGTGRTQLAGINIAGFDFGCTTDGTCDPSKVYPPLQNYTVWNNNPDGVGQMNHFAKNDGLNIFRLPVGWQYLVNNVLGGTLDPTNSAAYDQLVQACLGTGAYCIIDIHNYARWNSGVIGQGGPTNAQFADLWRQLAIKYKSQPHVWFGIMNEPHDISIGPWATTVQAVVTAIRNAGATSQYVSLPGNDWQSAANFVPDGSAAALAQVTNPDGSTTGLVFDVHKYLDSDNSGTSTTCVTNNIDTAFKPLAAWLRQNNRQAILTETGGGNTASCVQYLCEQFDYLNQNSDVYLGYLTWAAGSFDPTYPLTETPTGSGSSWTDTALVSACLARQ